MFVSGNVQYGCGRPSPPLFSVLLTGRQVKDDADRGRVVDDVRPLVQVVHVIAAVVATVTKY